MHTLYPNKNRIKMENSSSFFSRWFGRSNREPERHAETQGDRRTTTLHGIRVELDNSRPDIESDAVLERLDEALGLVAHHQPIRFTHLARDIDAIRVIRFPTRGAYLPGDNVIITELTFLARRDISAAPVASSILHEGVHARVAAFRRDVLGGWVHSDDMAKEERLCRRAELTFGYALPPELGAPVIDRALATLAMTDTDVAPAVDWNLAAQRVRAVDEGA